MKCSALSGKSVQCSEMMGEEARGKTTKARGNDVCSETVFAGHDSVIAHRNSQKLGPRAHNEAIQISSSDRMGLTKPCS